MTQAAAVVDALPVLESPAAGKAEPFARLRREFEQLESDTRAAAKKRLAGTRLEKLLDKLPGTLSSEVDALLERVGLVRKSRLEIVKEEPAVDDAAAPVLEGSELEAPAPTRKKKRA
ncbi:MAG: hypothetical protein Q8O67_01170 [Deltaproteobacteria bacterium]|nr:hypothetical protein [Deltaproteobacteria bacterium]